MARPDLSPDHHTINGLIAALFIAALPHFIYQPFWVGLAFTLMISWRLLHNLRGWPLPASSIWLRVLHNGTAALMIVIIFSHFGLTIGRDAGAALLTIMLAFKVVEIRSIRDYYLTCYLGYFLVITNFFYTQSLFIVVLMMLVIVLLNSCLISVNTSTSAQSLKKRLNLSGKMVLKALPVMLFLFMLFPRIPGPIWGLPEDAGGNGSATMSEQLTLGEIPPDQNRGTSGLNDEIQMGKISQLIQSDEIAFRVQFEDDNVPPNKQLYWRGPVLWQSDGTVWSPLQTSQLNEQALEVDYQSQAVDYTITLEPHKKRWLFALDFPTAKPQGLASYFAPDGSLNSAEKMRNRRQYQLSSSTDYQLNASGDRNLWAALQLPAGKHPRTRALAESWLEETSGQGDFIDRALAFFNQQDFVYSLSPPQLRGDIVDSFLFETREGFCEHYAASFTILMRAAGIPARIVTGYQGGDLNPVDNVLTVRQRDAHAWTEVWLPEQGWIRVDPTAAVSSQRLENGINDLLPASRRSPGMIANNDMLVELWQDMKNNWDAFNTAWDIWVVGFDSQIQKELLSRLGMNNPDWRKMIAVLTALLAITGIIMLLMSFYRRQTTEPVVAYYQRFCYKLARVGIHKAAHEGPQDFARRAEQHLPAYQRQIQSITELYARLRYRRDNSALLSELADQIKAFRPRR
jgi:transglutaminase-like putative cysteine protease